MKGNDLHKYNRGKFILMYIIWNIVDVQIWEIKNKGRKN